MNLSQVCSKIIYLSFHALFFFVPLILCPLNFELFEYNKMMLTYTICIVICTAWVLKMLSEKRFYIRKTPLDIPVLFFLASQIISTFFSIDPHTSIFGFYSRSHGGILSTICYILLYYALVSNIQSRKSRLRQGFGGQATVNLRPMFRSRESQKSKLETLSLLKTVLFSAALVAVYGILQHPSPLFKENGVWRGIDHQHWIQDVELRVFSTIGQPNWLAAYLGMLIPIAIAFMLVTQINADKKADKRRFTGPKVFYLILASLFYLCLLFTNSRAGAAGSFIALLAFFGLLFLKYLKEKSTVFSKQNLTFLATLLLTFGFLTFVSGNFLLQRFVGVLPFSKKTVKEQPQESPTGFTQIPPTTVSPLPALSISMGETRKIRNIVWKGAIEIFKHYPLFGSGVETFAYSYYQFRPQEHNLTTEWDFLYNKAHNEYLNFLATTGIVGLTTYLLIIFTFGWWFIKYYMRINANLNSTNLCEFTLILGLFCGYLVYLVQNFYSFSVVPVATFFFLFPGIAFVLTEKLSVVSCQLSVVKRSTIRYPLYAIIILASTLGLFTLGRMWLADTSFAKAHNLAQSGYFNTSYLYSLRAIARNPKEPLYYDQLAYNAAVLAASAEEATTSAFLAQKAVLASQKALIISPLNINFWKTTIKVFYQLGSLNDEFYQKALEAAKIAIELSPTEPKLPYNLGLIYLQLDDQEKAIECFKKAVDLKPNLRDPHYALAVVYYEQATSETNKKLLKNAISKLKYILNNIDPGDIDVQEKLKTWQAQ